MAGYASGLAGWPRGGNGRTNGRTYGWKISPFYRTSSPIGAAALPPSMKTKEKVAQGKGTADYLMPLGDWLSSGFCLSVCLSVSLCLSVNLSQCVCRFLSVSVCLFICLSVGFSLSIWLSVCMCLSVCRFFVYLSVSFCLSSCRLIFV